MASSINTPEVLTDEQMSALKGRQNPNVLTDEQMSALKEKRNPKPSVYQKAINVAEKVVPFITPFGSTVGSNLKELKGYIENPPSTLPAVGGMVGSIVAGRGGAVGRAVGAGVGQAGGKALEQTIGGDKRAITEPSRIKDIALEGAKGALMQGGGELALKQAPKVIAAVENWYKAPSNLREGLNQYLEHLNTILTPKRGEMRKTLLEKFGNKPATGLDQAKEFVEKNLGVKGIEIKDADASKLTKNQKSSYAGATYGKSYIDPETMAKALEATGQSAESLKLTEIQKTLSGKTGKTKLEAKLPTTPTKKYETMADVWEAVQKGGLTYNDIMQMKGNIAKKAFFNLPDEERALIPESFEYGKLAKILDDVLHESAKTGKFKYADEIIREEGRKFYRRNFLKELISGKNGANELVTGAPGTRYLDQGKQIDLSKMAEQLRKYAPDQLERIFKGDKPYIDTLMGISNEYAGRVPKKSGITNELIEAGRAYLTPNNVGMVAHPTLPIARRAGIESSISQVLAGDPSKTSGKFLSAGAGITGKEGEAIKDILYRSLLKKGVPIKQAQKIAYPVSAGAVSTVKEGYRNLSDMLSGYKGKR